jgi:hypothetical protein
MPTINFDSQIDPAVTSIAVNNSNGDFQLEIICRSEAAAKDLQETLGGLKKIYEMGTGSQNFKLQKFSQGNASVKISGNIFNALTIIKEKGVFSTAVLDLLDTNQEFQTIIQSSKQFTLSSTSTINFFNADTNSLTPLELNQILELKQQISNLSDEARFVLLKNLYDKYIDPNFDHSSANKITLNPNRTNH